MAQYEARQRNLQRWIDADPWTVTFYAKGRTPDDAETTFTATGRVSLASIREFTYSSSGPLQGEEYVARYLSVLVVPADTPTIRKGMRVTATHDASGMTNEYDVHFARQVPHKWEVGLNDRQ